MFTPRWLALLDTLCLRARGGEPFRITIVGGGAGGVELALAVHHTLTAIRSDVHVGLISAGTHLSEGHAPRAQRRFEAMLPVRGIDVLTKFSVREVDAAGVSDGAGRRVRSDFVLWVTGVEAPKWLRATGLALDAEALAFGVESVRGHLQRFEGI